MPSYSNEAWACIKDHEIKQKKIAEWDGGQ